MTDASRTLDGLDLARLEAHRRDPNVTPVLNALLVAVATYGTAVLDHFQAQPWESRLFGDPEHQAQALAWLAEHYPPTSD